MNTAYSRCCNTTISCTALRNLHLICRVVYFSSVGMDEYEEYMIPHIPMNDENKVEEEYGVIFRMGEDRLRRQVLSKSWFFGYIIDHFKGVCMNKH